MSISMEAGFERLKDGLAEIFARDVEFPPGMLVTVLGAKMTQDRRFAKITLSVFPTGAQQQALDVIDQYKHEINNGVAKRLRIRVIPKLHYVFDDTEAEAAVIDAELNRLKEAGEL
jgi:ribosome-binding factor A